MAAAKKKPAAKRKAPAKAGSRVKSPFGGTMVKGGLHSSLGVPQGQKIPPAKLAAAAAGKYGPKAKKQAQMAKNMEGLRKR